MNCPKCGQPLFADTEIYICETRNCPVSWITPFGDIVYVNDQTWNLS